MEHIGRQQAFGIAVEGNRGDAELVADRWVRKVAANVIPRAERVDDDSTFGRLEESDRTRIVRKWNEGDVSGILHADVFGYFLTNVYGDVVSTVVAGQVYDHVFNLDQTITHPTLTLFVKDGETRQAKIAGGVVSNLEINVTTDDFIRFSASFSGKEEESDSSEVSYSQEYDFISRDVTVKVANSLGGLSSAEAIKVKTLDISWDTGAILDYVVGDYSPDNIYNGRMVIEGSFTKNYVDQVFENLYKADDARYMQITIEGEATIGSTYHPTITIVLYKAQINDWSRSSDADALSEETVNFKGYFNVNDNKQSQVTLRNLTPEYIPGS